MNNLCLDCNQSHEDQRENYPVGTHIDFREDFAQTVDATDGIVTGHCADGRAMILIAGKIHTFHHRKWFLTVEKPQITALITITDVDYWLGQAARIEELAQIGDSPDLDEVAEADAERAEIEQEMAEYFISLLRAG